MEIQASRLEARVRPVGRADPAARPEPGALGSAADPPRPCGTRAGRGTRQATGDGARPLRTAGRHRRLPCARAHGGGDRLGAHRRALWRAERDHAVAGGGAQSRGGAGDAVRSGGGPGDRRCADGRAGAQGLSPAAQRARRSSATSSAASRRRAPSSSAPPPSPATNASASCCWAALQPVALRPADRPLEPLRVHPSGKSGFTLMPGIGRA